MGYIALGDLISKAQVEKCGKREYPVLSMTMHDGIVFQNDRFKKDIASIDRSNYSVVGFNQLVVSFPIDEGVLAVQDITDAGIVSPAYKIWDIDQAKLVPKYLEMWLRSPRSIDYYKSKLRGTTARRRSIPEEDVDLITRVKGVILLREQELAALDDLIKARFVEMFGDCRINPKAWNTVELGEISDVGSSKRVFVEELRETGIPFYRGTEVGALAEGKAITPELFITQEHYEELIEATGKPLVGDLLMPSICPDGRIWVVDTEEPFYFKDGRVLWVHSISKEFDPVFLLYTLKDRIMTDYSSIASGTTFAELKIFALKQCRVFAVPMDQQKQFVSFVKQIDKSKFI